MTLVCRSTHRPNSSAPGYAMSKTTPESQESTSRICKAAAFLYSPDGAPVFGELIGRIKLGGIRSLP